MTSQFERMRRHLGCWAGPAVYFVPPTDGGLVFLRREDGEGEFRDAVPGVIEERNERGGNPPILYHYYDRDGRLAMGPADGDAASAESSATADSFWLFDDGAFTIAYNLPGEIRFLCEQGIIEGDRKATVIVGYDQAGDLARVAVTMRSRDDVPWDAEAPGVVEGWAGSWRGTQTVLHGGGEQPGSDYERSLTVAGPAARLTISDDNGTIDASGTVHNGWIDLGSIRTLLLPAGLSVTVPTQLDGSGFAIDLLWRVSESRVEGVGREYGPDGWKQSMRYTEHRTG